MQAETISPRMTAGTRFTSTFLRGNPTMTIRTSALLLTGAAFASSAGHAQTADHDGAEAGQLQEVVITAQKRPERLSEIPVAAAVISNEAISNNNSGDISDLNKLVPSVNLNGSFNGRVPMGIRG